MATPVAGVSSSAPPIIVQKPEQFTLDVDWKETDSEVFQKLDLLVKTSKYRTRFIVGGLSKEDFDLLRGAWEKQQIAISMFRAKDGSFLPDELPDGNPPLRFGAADCRAICEECAPLPSLVVAPSVSSMPPTDEAGAAATGAGAPIPMCSTSNSPPQPALSSMPVLTQSSSSSAAPPAPLLLPTMPMAPLAPSQFKYSLEAVLWHCEYGACSWTDNNSSYCFRIVVCVAPPGHPDITTVSKSSGSSSLLAQPAPLENMCATDGDDGAEGAAVVTLGAPVNVHSTATTTINVEALNLPLGSKVYIFNSTSSFVIRGRNPKPKKRKRTPGSEFIVDGVLRSEDPLSPVSPQTPQDGSKRRSSKGGKRSKKSWGDAKSGSQSPTSDATPTSATTPTSAIGTSTPTSATNAAFGVPMMTSNAIPTIATAVSAAAVGGAGGAGGSGTGHFDSATGEEDSDLSVLSAIATKQEAVAASALHSMNVVPQKSNAGTPPQTPPTPGGTFSQQQQQQHQLLQQQLQSQMSFISSLGVIAAPPTGILLSAGLTPPPTPSSPVSSQQQQQQQQQPQIQVPQLHPQSSAIRLGSVPLAIAPAILPPPPAQAIGQELPIEKMINAVTSFMQRDHAFLQNVYAQLCHRQSNSPRDISNNLSATPSPVMNILSGMSDNAVAARPTLKQ